jgi:hypothetical protein
MAFTVSSEEHGAETRTFDKLDFGDFPRAIGNFLTRIVGPTRVGNKSPLGNIVRRVSGSSKRRNVTVVDVCGKSLTQPKQLKFEKARGRRRSQD